MNPIQHRCFPAGRIPLAAGLCLGLFLALPACTLPPRSSADAVAPAPAAVVSVAASELRPRLATSAGSPLLLDVRTAEEYAAGHLPGAYNLPHDQLPQRLAELGEARDREVIVYCRSGRGAELALEVLQRAGFQRLGHLQGDYLGWTEEGWPVEVSDSADGRVPATSLQR